jgi:hypothetical protein
VDLSGVFDQIAVVDYDATRGKYYESVNLNDPFILIPNGLTPSESDPRFHQQMVYAVASDTIEQFETVLGRRIHWRRTDRSLPCATAVKASAARRAIRFSSRHGTSIVFSSTGALRIR